MGQTSTVINISLPILSFLEAFMPFIEGKSSGRLFPNTHHWTAVQFQDQFMFVLVNAMCISQVSIKKVF